MLFRAVAAKLANNQIAAQPTQLHSKTDQELKYLWKQRQKKKHAGESEKRDRKYRELKNYFKPAFDFITSQGEKFAGDVRLNWDNSTVTFLVKPAYETEFFKMLQPLLDNFDLPGYESKPILNEERVSETYDKSGKFYTYEIKMPELD